MAETWYRGQSSSVAPAQPGGHIHDFGDGMYLTNSLSMAEEYARTRTANGGGAAEVLTVTLERAELGRLLDLNSDPRWQQFLRRQQLPGVTTEQLIRQANENYGRFFDGFVQENNIRIQDYDAVIGPEFVRNGTQLCIRHRGGQPSQLAVQVRGRLQPVAAAPAMPVAPGQALVQQSRVQGIVGNQAAMALLGQLLSGAIQSLGDIGTRREVQRRLQTTHAAAIQNILARGDGVLVIIAMQEWIIPDFNGNRARGLLSVYVEGGPTQTAALASWRNTPKLLQGPPLGWRRYEQYAWIDPYR
ncbi:MAG: hypothetical protein HY235_16325 [Acidobacteria bacterium]|nr:hypothetical protein [Acidobacteriota bacterium]